MNKRPPVPRDVTDRQIAVSDPEVSAWVSANAGSGKTHVLTQRVIRLLLDGVDPAKILCLTFTKAAAANMATRVFNTLSSWIALDDAALGDAILKIEGKRPGTARRLRARRLFAEALETPGGLKVQTIHAFCTGLLHQFPFEADVAARFEVMEERAAAELIDRLRLEVLLEAAAKPDTPLGRALSAAIVAAADMTFADVMREAVAERDVLDAWVRPAGGVDAAIAGLSRSLGIAPNEAIDDLEAEFFAGPHLPQSAWAAAIGILGQGLKSDREQATRLRNAQAETGSARVEAYLEIFCTKKFEPRAQIVTRRIETGHPELFARLSAEQDRVCALLERRRAIRLRDRTGALVRIAVEVLARYRAEKERAGLLDYDDLIDKTLALLSGEGSAAWVMYKLDLGIDHVLIDEAQDTSPKQWEVVRRLTAEFTAGEGARAGVKRTIFAVGDEKQSIFSFQGAAPHYFADMRQHFAARHRAVGSVFEAVELRASFRSTPDVLGAVDAVFRRPEAHAGLTADPVPTVHEAVRSEAPGCVDIWPLEEPAQRPALEAWDAPFDTSGEDNPRARLARRIAATIKCWLTRGDVLEATGAPIRPGDVLVLVRQRGPLFEAIIRALKDQDVDVAGADRLVLTEHIAVMDLMSLADALLLPEDDLALAEALSSPLFGFDEDRLFALAHGRRGSLRSALRQKAAADPAFAVASAMLDALADSAQRDTPFAFYARLLGPGGGRRRMLARLGVEATDALDEFLALALDYESRHTPSLQGFVGWMRASTTEVKRDMDIARDEVRVMTVHGAKGLEAPIVILADTTTKPAGPREPRLLTLGEAGAPLVWVGAREGDVAPVAHARTLARTEAENEHRRLLYVAMTRAADRLIVCGARSVNAPPEGCWYALVHDALEPEAFERPAEAGDGTFLRWQKPGSAHPETAGAPAAPAAPGLDSAPDWLTRPAPAPATRQPRVITPSSAYEGVEAPPAGTASGSAVGTAEEARLRGTLVHRLLQALPEMPPESRAGTSRRFLARARPALSEEAIEAVTTETLGVLEHPAFAPLFAPGSRAEVPIAGRIAVADASPVWVSGQVDRLAVTDAAVLIADFKTDRMPPLRHQDVAPGYITQLALYRAVLARLYPGREIRAAIVYSHAPALIELAGPVLDAALTCVCDATA